MKDLILVTGSHRSGSTWVGKMLSLSPRVGYLHEPFNPNPHPGYLKNPFDKWFMYINDDEYDKYLASRFSGKYSLIDKFIKSRKLKSLFGGLFEYVELSSQKLRSRKTVIKDPIAFFSTPYLFERFSMKVVMIARHPAAFISSLKKTNWEFDFNDLLDQKELLNDWIGEYTEEITDFTKKKHDIIDQGILLWNIFHSTMIKFKRKYPNWEYVRHEDLSANPVKEFRKLYSNLSLEWDSKIEKEIWRHTSDVNPLQIEKTHAIKVDSKKNIYSWKERLSKEEIKRIQDGTRDVSKYFYKKEEW